MSQTKRDQARDRKRRQRDRERDKSVTDVTVERDMPPEMSRSDVTPDGRPIHVMRWTDADGVAQVTRYCGPLPDWKGLGYCRDCNQAVMSGSNYCGCEVLG